jgi:hypothetical protein
LPERTLPFSGVTQKEEHSVPELEWNFLQLSSVNNSSAQALESESGVTKTEKIGVPNGTWKQFPFTEGSTVACSVSEQVLSPLSAKI